MRRYFIKTFGCQLNEAESERVAAVLEKKGYQPAENIQKADLVVINSCSVRESAENRVFGLINSLQNSKIRIPKGSREAGKFENSKIVLTGCMVGSAKGEQKRYTLAQLKQRLPQVDEFRTIEELVGNSKLVTRNSLTEALVPIMRGCSHFCSYCVVPYAQGKEKSRSFTEIVCEVEKLAKRGYKKIILLGQNVNSYKPSFAKLLKRLHQIKKIKKISFITSNPWGFTDEIVNAISLPKIDRYLHLPVQSGDNKVLKKMNRPYTALQYIKLVEKIRKKIPEIKITTDLIVGFPGENKKQFENTVKLCQKINFVKAYISKYSPRPGTAAFKLKDDIPPLEKKRRWKILEKMINIRN